jgi:lipoprotein-anchoring transpeptidase ErfK/SrfK
MKRILMAAALGAAVMFSPLSAAVAATGTPDTPASVDKLLLKKKKQAEAARIAAARAEADYAKAKAAALAKKKPVASLSARKPVKKVAPASVAARNVTPCKGFMQCLFTRHQKVRVLRDPALMQTASIAQSDVLSGRTMHKTVAWSETQYPVGSVIVRTPERALYYVLGDGKAIRYSVGVGKEGMQWSGNSSIVAKQEWPDWTPPQVMIEREAAKGHYIPDHMDGGPGNPLGARAMYIGGTMYRIHGTNNEASIGGAVSSGCIRMMNADVIDLFERVKIGAKVFVYL